MDENQLKSLLVKENAEFRRLFQEHQRFENRLAAFKNKPFLSDEERLEEKDLKKKKLALKDQMYGIMKDFREPL
jgi:uncharacterized protein YdcH (DUF465 family)